MRVKAKDLRSSGVKWKALGQFGWVLWIVYVFAYYN
jgi:hypothetical protein